MIRGIPATWTRTAGPDIKCPRPDADCPDGPTPATGTTAAMLRHRRLIHPKINEVLGRAGHHAKVLIADGNYPASSTLGPNAELVSLNLMPGVVTCTQVLEALASAIPIEAAHTMD